VEDALTPYREFKEKNGKRESREAENRKRRIMTFEDLEILVCPSWAALEESSGVPGTQEPDRESSSGVTS